MMEEIFPTYIKRLIIANHKCFYKPTTFDFEPGFNILIGENSSGKSTVLEALDPATQLVFHNTQLSETEPRVRQHKPASIEISTAMTVLSVASLSGSNRIYVGNLDAQTHQTTTWDEHRVQNKLNADPYLHFGMCRRLEHPAAQAELVRLCFPSYESYWQPLNESLAASGCATFDAYPFSFHNPNESGNQSRLWGEIRAKLVHRTYRFATERRILPQCGFQGNTELASDGSNLAFCLNNLQTTSGTLFRDLVSYVKYVLPHVKSINAPPENNNFVIKINHVDDEENRSDLAVGLSQVGTGVGNVIAMLYVAITAQTPRTFLLEEPNSYLHPRALRELLAILGETDIKHQYFITTHSSDVLRAVKPSTVTMLEYNGQTSSRRQVMGNRLAELKSGLMDMGIRMTDLHGCDHVIWVEGETEEAVFPLIIREHLRELASRIAVLRVHSTSDFDASSRHAKLDPVKVAEIYVKLSDGNALAPIMSGIILDREGRQKSECERIEKDGNGRILFLGRTMLEDYLLNAEAIAALIREHTNEVVETSAIETMLEAGKALPECWVNAKAKQPVFHAAKLLNHTIASLTNNKLTYRKTLHAPQLVEHLLRYKPEALDDLKTLLRKVVTGKRE
jgi:predicted ATPase